MAKIIEFITIPRTELRASAYGCNSEFTVVVPKFRISRDPVTIRLIKPYVKALFELKSPEIARAHAQIEEEWMAAEDSSLALNCTNWEAASVCNAYNARLPSVFEMLAALKSEFNREFNSLRALYEGDSKSIWRSSGLTHTISYASPFVQQNELRHFPGSVSTHTSTHPDSLILSGFGELLVTNQLSHVKMMEPRVFVHIPALPFEGRINEALGIPLVVFETGQYTKSKKEYRPTLACFRMVRNCVEI